MEQKRLKPVHPGEVLAEEFLKPMGLSHSRLALAIGVHPRRINEIVLEKRGITADTALRLARFFGMTAGSGSGCKRTTSWTWLNRTSMELRAIQQKRFEGGEIEVSVYNGVSALFPSAGVD